MKKLTQGMVRRTGGRGSGAGNDTLIEGEGNDTLNGGAGSDIIDGGAGYDTYTLEGSDTLRDSDGQGILKDKAGNIISGAIQKNADGTYTYLSDSSVGVTLDANLALTLTLADGTVAVIENFTSGDLGISFRDQPPADLPTVYYTATETAERILGGGEVYALGGNDIVLGQADLAAAPIEVLQGDGGDDTLYSGDIQLATDIAIANGKTAAGAGPYGDWLAGGAGDDTLIAGARNDILAGGGGADLIIAGAGDDFVYGDVDFDSRGQGGAILKLEQLADGSWQLSAPNLTPDPVDAGNDTIYAGNGIDRVWAGRGDDAVYGEAGDDVIAGEGGNDTLLGGAGADRIWGNGGNDTLLGGAGDDELSGDNGDGSGAEGNDTIDAGAGSRPKCIGISAYCFMPIPGIRSRSAKSAAWRSHRKAGADRKSGIGDSFVASNRDAANEATFNAWRNAA